jgi:hypothetical protein
VAAMMKARRASGSMLASLTPRDKRPPSIRRTHSLPLDGSENTGGRLPFLGSQTSNTEVLSKRSVTDESLRALVPEGSVGDWLNPPEQAGRQNNGLDELQHGLTNFLENCLRESSGSENGAMPWSPIALVVNNLLGKS